MKTSLSSLLTEATLEYWFLSESVRGRSRYFKFFSTPFPSSSRKNGKRRHCLESTLHPNRVTSFMNGSLLISLKVSPAQCSIKNLRMFLVSLSRQCGIGQYMYLVFIHIEHFELFVLVNKQHPGMRYSDEDQLWKSLADDHKQSKCSKCSHPLKPLNTGLAFIHIPTIELHIAEIF